MQGNILTPAAFLVVWTMVLLIWMFATRRAALQKTGVGGLKLGARGPDFDGVIDDRTQWKAHSYNYQFEQPTIFYAATFILVLSGYRPADVLLA